MGCLSVLVIEDEHDIRVAIRNCLEEEGFFVFSAANGENGLGLLRRIKPPGLILLDLNMPISSGYDFIAEKNQDETVAHIPVIVMSAAGNRARVSSQGVVDFIPKPIELDSLLKAVHHYCGPPSP